MLGFIENQTNWYLEKTKAINKTTRDLKLGNPIKYKRKLEALQKAENIAYISFYVADFFSKGENQQVKELKQQTNATLELARTFLKTEFNRIHNENTRN